ncbi:DUF4247 domain-containing protein [Aquibacillus albus]|uniref:DUF4247 domain-containing protein n=1 Tax=Aquibacillus albus TaxID=1168171 RepID=A0ABS2N442_9BACI|nr:DUF4247 domain-containing protein [Aquibacillus albus]MBM7572869.1 hypothetical protein [Aquibacillus albus]
MKKSCLVVFLFVSIFLTACGYTNIPGFEEPTVSVSDIPDEPTKEQLLDEIKASSTSDIEAVISNHFYLLDVVEGDNGQANIYATNRLSISELVSVLSDIIQPEEISDLKDNQQILIYPNNFVTIKESEEDNNAVLMEVASKQFVQNHYSPSFLSTYFAIRTLESVLGVPNWGNRQRNQCSNGGCYGGYTMDRNQNRGMSTYRGGGPSAGK